MKRDLITITREFTHFHFCCGLGGGKKGFNRAQPQVGNMAATLRCIGGIDNDPAAIRDFDRAGPGRPGTVMDLFTREQYTAFHGKEPPADWREATAVDIRRAAGNESPNIVFISSPCKGASGLLSESLSKTAKYQALNELTLRCIWLMAEAWADNPVDLIVFENVPRLATRGRHLLDQINQLLQQFGYAVAAGSGQQHEAMRRLVDAGLATAGRAANEMTYFHATRLGCKVAGLDAAGIKRAMED